MIKMASKFVPNAVAAAICVAAAWLATVAYDGYLRTYATIDPYVLRYRSDPATGYSLRPDFELMADHISGDGSKFAVKTDAAGTIVRRNGTSTHPTAIFIGDSMIEGLAVPPDKNMGAVYAARLGDAQAVLNPSISGWSPARYAAWFRAFEDWSRVDAVFIFLYFNDFNDDARLVDAGEAAFDADGAIASIRPQFERTDLTEWHALATQRFRVNPARFVVEYSGSSAEYLIRLALSKLNPRASAYPMIPARVANWSTRGKDSITENVYSVYAENLPSKPDDVRQVRRTFGFVRDAIARIPTSTRVYVVRMPAAFEIAGYLAGVEAGWGMSAGDVSVDHAEFRNLFAQNCPVDARTTCLDLEELFRRPSGPAMFGPIDKHLSELGHAEVGAYLADRRKADR